MQRLISNKRFLAKLFCIPILVFCISTLQNKAYYKSTNLKSCLKGYEINDYGGNDNLCVSTSRYNDTSIEKLKTILMWNLAYGTKEYGIGFGREPFYKYKCPDTRCVSTSNRTYLKNIEDFDAILFHQRSFDFTDLPKKRKPHQRYIHWIIESAQYLYMDIHKLNGIFNWTMTYRQDSDFYLPYGRFHKIKTHPEGEELKKYIKEFGLKNQHLARTGKNVTSLRAAWFVSHCATQARREKFVKSMQNYMDVDVYGKCSRGPIKRSCGRDQELECYRMMEEQYKFYLSFENSICDDYITEKYFNIFKYNVIPVTYSGGKFTEIAPPHSSINVLEYPSVKSLVEYLEKLHKNDNLFAEYFWWKEFYTIRNRIEDGAQSYCDLCSKLNNPDEPPNVYNDMYKWWVTDSNCKKLKPANFQ